MKHVTEPLDYLYEELPPEEMAEVRAHLSQCPKCREEMRKIRDVVKLYREGDGPRPPAGLAGRAAAAALAARNRDVAESLETKPDETPDQDYERIKREVREEARPGWRARLFHPAWTVAASVIFVCSVLIHISPRGRTTVWEPPAPAPAAGVPESAPRPLSRLPQARARTVEPVADSAVAAPPLLREAEALGKLPPPEAELPAMDAAPLPAAAPVPYAETDLRPPPVAAPALAPVPAAPPPVAAFSTSAAPEAPAQPSAAPVPPPKTASQGEADVPAEVILMDLAPAMEPPQLIARPTPVDTRQSIGNLITVAGMLIGTEEYDEAREAIALLRHYDPKQADALMQLLLKAEAATLADKAAREAETAVQPDKYYAPPAEAPAVPAAPERAQPAQPAQPAEPPASPVTPASPAPALPTEELVIPDPPVVTIGEEPVAEAAVPLPVVPVPSEPVSLAVPPERSPAPADAPSVPKASPDAVPPTLWEWNEPRPARQPARSQPAERPRWNPFRRSAPPDPESLPAWRQTRRFTTDPYLREN